MRKYPFSPSAIVAAFLLTYVGVSLAQAEGDPRVFASIGAGFRDGLPVDESNLGYDGQFAYFIALDPAPSRLLDKLDVPAYRYQRILYPLLARVLGLGQAALIPWTLVLVNLCAHVAGTALLEDWLAAKGVSRWYALTYGLWAGLALPVRGNLTEPLCYALVVAAFWAQHRRRAGWAAMFTGLAVFTKETALLFLAAQLAAALLAKQWRAVLTFAIPLLPYALFQIWLYSAFGSIGLTSGGFMATGFELIPYMGLWRVAELNFQFFIIYGLVVGPLIVFPSLWGIFAGARQLWRRDFAPMVWALALNAAVVPFTPFSTFREPFGILRFVDGLVLATVLFGAHTQSKRVLNYGLLWGAALVLVLRS